MKVRGWDVELYCPDPELLAKAFKEDAEMVAQEYRCLRGFCGHKHKDPACRRTERPVSPPAPVGEV